MSTQVRSIAIVRHGETDWNQARRIQGRTEVELNAVGRVQAAEAGRRFGELREHGPWGRLVTSPMLRAVQTAEIIAAELGLAAPNIDTELWERDFGPAEGLLIDEVEARWPGLEIPGAESVAALAERAAGAFLRTLDEAPGTVLVAHGALIRVGLSRIGGFEMPRIVNGEIWLLARGTGSAPQITRLG